MNAAAVKKLALSLGFSHCGIAPADALVESAQQQYRQVIEQQFYGEMHYLARQPASRFNPRTLLPSCHSVIVCLYPYCTGQRPAHDYQFAKYAQICDYHKFIKYKIAIIGETLQRNQVGTQFKITVDNSPITEKQWAVAAGVGIMGKNSLIHNEQGSFFVIGLLLTDAILEYDMPQNGGMSDCGNCEQCVKACPTCALNIPYQLDARRCFSYLSTTKAPISESELPADKRVFGCDICQEACPKNSYNYNAVNKDAEQYLSAYMSYSNLELQKLDEPAFRMLFKETPLARMSFEKWKLLLR
ncbi:MAG: tRNA epoxyqueuosine(34) reductase QueG [Bacteroidales bacterium]|jgi:epoxyqueuosine reductase|nr:tRNA epoxyqueuosine(34) reductase QueG [Bacteroidales bacterium]